MRKEIFDCKKVKSYPNLSKPFGSQFKKIADYLQELGLE